MGNKLPKYTLGYDEEKKKWALGEDKTKKTIKTFINKEGATKRGVLKGTLGKKGGSVKIQKLNHKYQEERTYPKSKDPIKSKG